MNISHKATTKHAAYYLLSVILILSLSESAFAFTVNVEPASPIDIDDVLVNSITYQDITLTTDTESDVRIDLQVNGIANNWASIDPSYVVISKTKPAKVRLVLEPKTVVPGIYFGYIVLTVFSEQPMTSSMSWSDSIQFKVRVTEDTTSGAALSDLVVFDMREGDNLHIEGMLTNTGNTMLYPVITVDVMSADGLVPIENYILQGVGLSHGEDSVVLLDRPIYITPGEYIAKIELSADDLTFQRQIISFNVAPAGVQQGIVRDIDATQFFDGVQEKISIAGSFMNTGASQRRVRFVAVIYQDGVAIERLQSEEKIVLPDMVDAFSVVFVPSESGNYTIRGYFEHDNQRTAEKELDIFIGRSSEVELGASWAVIFMILVILVAVVFWFRRSNKTAELRNKRDEELKGKQHS